MRHTVPPWLLLSLFACSKAPDVETECGEGRACPAGQICLAAEGRCVPLADAPDLPLPEAPDLHQAPADLSMPACTGERRQYASSALVLPTSTQRFEIDFDGDGRPDNQLRRILSTLTGLGLDLQTPVDMAVRDGLVVALMALEAPGLRDAACASVRLNTATPAGPGDPRPRYDGTDRFKVPAGQPTTHLEGTIAAGQLNTTGPTRLPENAPRLELRLPLLGAELPLTLYGVHVQGTVLVAGISQGEIHGVIHKDDVDQQVIPALANLATQLIRSDPLSPMADTLVRLLEDPVGNAASRAKCMVAADCCQKPEHRKTCKILPDEVRTNPIVGNLIAPDVQVFSGRLWKPVPGGRDRNGLSVGLGFAAVPASF
ncbi:MAG: hypothetical protein RMK29_09070 [Myxococcales bacterium]|nr:hypothetical protein [Myxococcota bacterium]MDW8281849.1 hypothetical protein [Myxococcales bacterium]